MTYFTLASSTSHEDAGWHLSTHSTNGAVPFPTPRRYVFCPLAASLDSMVRMAS